MSSMLQKLATIAALAATTTNSVPARRLLLRSVSESSSEPSSDVVGHTPPAEQQQNAVPAQSVSKVVVTRTPCTNHAEVKVTSNDSTPEHKAKTEAALRDVQTKFAKHEPACGCRECETADADEGEVVMYKDRNGYPYCVNTGNPGQYYYLDEQGNAPSPDSGSFADENWHLWEQAMVLRESAAVERRIAEEELPFLKDAMKKIMEYMKLELYHEEVKQNRDMHASMAGQLEQMVLLMELAGGAGDQVARDRAEGGRAQIAKMKGNLVTMDQAMKGAKQQMNAWGGSVWGGIRTGEDQDGEIYVSYCGGEHGGWTIKRERRFLSIESDENGIPAAEKSQMSSSLSFTWSDDVAPVVGGDAESQIALCQREAQAELGQM